MKRTPTTILILCGTAALPVLSGTSLGAMYPVLKRVFDLTGIEIGILVAIATITQMMMAPIAGRIADLVGLVRVIVPLMVVYACGAFLSGLSAFSNQGNFTLLLVGRSLQGIGAIGAGPIAITFVKSMMGEQAGRHIARIEASASTGAVIGPLVGGIVVNWRWYAAFFIDGSIMTVLLIILASSIWRDEVNLSRLPQANAFLPPDCTERFLPTSPIMGAYLGGFGLMFSLVGMQTFLVDYLKTSFNTPILAGSMVVAVHALLMAASAALSGPYLKSSRSRTMIMAGLTFFASALILLGLQVNLLMDTGILIVSGIGCGIILPPVNILVLHEAPRGSEAQAISLSASSRSSGALLGSLTAGWLTTFGYQTMFITIGALVLGMVGLASLLFHNRLSFSQS